MVAYVESVLKKTRGGKIRATQLVTLANNNARGCNQASDPGTGRKGNIYNQSLHVFYIALIIATINSKKSVYATFWSYWLYNALRSPLLSSETFIQREGETLGPHIQAKHFLLL